MSEPAPVTLRTVALPVEHGGWGLLAEPALLGLALAPSAAGLALALAALAAFLVRHPLRLVFLDRRRGQRHPRTAVAERVCLLYGAAALAFVLLALVLARAAFWPALLAALPPALVALAYDARGRSREALPELAGAVALSAATPAIALAGEAAPGPAFAAGALLALRALASILYVRARLRLERGQHPSPAPTLASHAGAVAVAALLAERGLAPRLGVLGLLLLLMRSAHGLSPLRRALRPQAVGFQELFWGAVNLTLLALGYRLGV